MEHPISAILLAAGQSGRMGQSKQLLPLGDRPLIRHCVDTILSSGIEDAVVVLSIQEYAISDALRGVPVTIALNTVPGSEMAESVRIGLSALDRSSTGVLICLADHPVVTAHTCRELMKEHRKEPDKIIIPRCGDKKGHPTLFPRETVDQVFTGLNLREIQQRHPDRILFIQVEDEGVITDIDTMDDYNRLLLKYRER